MIILATLILTIIYVFLSMLLTLVIYIGFNRRQYNNLGYDKFFTNRKHTDRCNIILAFLLLLGVLGYAWVDVL